jgi:hypothetical protein
MYHITIFPCLETDLLPLKYPTIDAITDSTHPPQMNIHSAEIQKLGSTMADQMPIALHRTGTYQIVRGFCLTMKKQQAAMNKEKRT